jgi:hypothetical protein
MIVHQFERPNRYSIPFILSKERIVINKESAVKKVPVEQELKASTIPALKKAVENALSNECYKDVGTIKIDAAEDAEGRRFIIIKAEVS